MYTINNPVTQGNPDIDPETIDTYETAIVWEKSRQLTMGFNLFYYKIQDFITTIRVLPTDTVTTAVNLGEIEGYGGEFELSWKPQADLEVGFNYAYQKSKDQNDDDIANTPNHQFHTGIKWQMNDSLNLSTDISQIGDRQRVASDARDALEGYTLVDIGVNYQPSHLRNFNSRLVVENVFDETAK